jgi:hypothetical protein
LKRKLERSEKRQSVMDGPSTTLTREVELERELEAAHAKTSKLRAENQALQKSIVELQSRLTDQELRGDGNGSSSPHKQAHGAQTLDASTVESALRRGEREKQLELMVS